MHVAKTSIAQLLDYAFGSVRYRAAMRDDLFGSFAAAIVFFDLIVAGREHRARAGDGSVYRISVAHERGYARARHGD